MDNFFVSNFNNKVRVSKSYGGESEWGLPGVHWTGQAEHPMTGQVVLCTNDGQVCVEVLYSLSGSQGQVLL